MPKPPTSPAEPSAPRRRRADAERSVTAILDAGLEALASDPDSSMSEIARRAGVVRATIYVHFPTRTALLDAVMEHATAQVVEAMRGAEPQRGEPVEALQRVLRATWRQLAQFHGLLALNTARLSAEELHRRHVPMLDQIEPLIERGQTARRLPERSPRRLAPRSCPSDRSHRQRGNPRWPPPGIRSRGCDAEHRGRGHLGAER